MKNLDQLVGKLVELRSGIHSCILMVQLTLPGKQLTITLPRIMMLFSVEVQFSSNRCVFLDSDHGLLVRHFYHDTGYSMNEVVE